MYSTSVLLQNTNTFILAWTSAVLHHKQMIILCNGCYDNDYSDLPAPRAFYYNKGGSGLHLDIVLSMESFSLVGENPAH